MEIERGYKNVIEPSDQQAQIASYLRSLPPEILGVNHADPIKVLETTHGTYNVNYHVCVGEKDFIFRINFEQQSGLPDQIEYEFAAMKYLEKACIAPKVYHLDNTKTAFEYGILIEEYLEGPYVRLVEEEMMEIASLIAALHTVPPWGLPFIVWRDPLRDHYRQLEGDLEEYKARLTPDREIIGLTQEFLKQSLPVVGRYSSWFKPECITHTDDAIDNFVRTSQGLRLIDWEKPRIDDSTFDVSCFLCEPAQLWCSPQVLSPRGREIFLDTYLRLSQREEEQFVSKLKIREPFTALHWVLWAANRLCAFRDGWAVDELLPVLSLKVERLERVAQPQQIEKALKSLAVNV